MPLAAASSPTTCHEHGCAVMIQLTHLGRRTGWDKADWLPVVSRRRRCASRRTAPSRRRPRTGTSSASSRDYADAAERMQAAGLDGIELEAYGHLIDQFWSPLTNDRDDDYGGSLDNRLRFTFDVLDAIRARGRRRTSSSASAMAGDEDCDGRPDRRRTGSRSRAGWRRRGMVDFLNVIRGHIDTDAGADRRHPDPGHALARRISTSPARSAPRPSFPVFHAARITDVATARHAIAAGKLDMVGMTRAHMADPHIVAQDHARARRTRIRPCVGATYCLDRIYEGGEALCIHNAATGRERDACRT